MHRWFSFFLGLKNFSFFAVLGHEKRIGRFWIIRITEMKHLGWASLDASRLHIRIQAVRAKITFVGDVIFIATNCSIGAGGLAIALMVAFVWDHPHDAVRAAFNGLGWACL